MGILYSSQFFCKFKIVLRSILRKKLGILLLLLKDNFSILTSRKVNKKIKYDTGKKRKGSTGLILKRRKTNEISLTVMMLLSS